MNSSAYPARLVISMDIEDWPQSTWDHTLDITQRAASNTERVLDILHQHKRTITMFVLGKFAERFPALVGRMAAEGHEVASHGYGHIEVFKQTPDAFRDDVLRARQILEDITGRPVLGYRAPDYSITAGQLWALDILAELGFLYDTSIFPSGFSRYGIIGWPPDPVQVRLPPDRALIEFPLTTFSWLGRRWPVAGGGYHRLLPWPAIRWLIAKQLQQGQPFITYCHPYEFDPQEFAQIDIKLPLKTRLHQGLGRRGFHAKFEQMLMTFKNIHLADLAKECQWPVYRIPEQAISERDNL